MLLRTKNGIERKNNVEKPHEKFVSVFNEKRDFFGKCIFTVLGVCFKSF